MSDHSLGDTALDQCREWLEEHLGALQTDRAKLPSRAEIDAVIEARRSRFRSVLGGADGPGKWSRDQTFMRANCRVVAEIAASLAAGFSNGKIEGRHLQTGYEVVRKYCAVGRPEFEYCE